MDKFRIKDVFSFDKKIYNQVTSRNRQKKLISLSLCIIILAVTIFIFIKIGYILNSSKFLLGDGGYSSNYLLIIAIALLVLAIILVFIVLYKFFSFVSGFSDGDILSTRCYILTNDSKLISLKFIEDFNSYRFNSYKNNILDKLIRFVLFESDLKNEKKNIDKKIQDKNINVSELIECLEIVNIYKIVEKDEELKIICDYIDLLNNVSCKRKEITIYKFFNNWEKILQFLKEKKIQKKNSLNEYDDGEHIGFVNFMIKSCLNSNNRFGLYILIILIMWSIVIRKDFLAAIIYMELALSGLVVVLYCKKKALEYLNFKSVDEKMLILSSVTRNKFWLLHIFYGINS